MQAAADTTALSIEPVSVTGALGQVAGELRDWLDALISLLPNLVVAVLIVVVTAFVARLVRRGVRAGLERTMGRVSHAKNVVGLLATLAYVAALAAGTFVALTVVKADGVVTTLLAGAGVVGLALGFAFQDIASNFIAGILMAIRTPFVIGQIVETNGYMGTIHDINLRSTIIETFEGQRVILPNAKVFQEPIVNYSRTAVRRVDVSVGVGYGDDLDAARRSAVAAIEGLEARKTDRPVQLYYTAFGGSSVDLVVRFWVDFSKQTDFLQAQSDAIQAIKTAFDRDGITIPFPIRTLDFDPNGGLPLADAMPRA